MTALTSALVGFLAILLAVSWARRRRKSALLDGLDRDTILRSRQEIREGKHFNIHELFAEILGQKTP